MFLSDHVFSWDLWPYRAMRELRSDHPVGLGAGVSVRHLKIPEQNPLWA